jgi:hypothetical protein
MPDTDNLITISRLFGVSIDELVGNTEYTEEEELTADKKSDTGSGIVNIEYKSKKTKRKIVASFLSIPYTLVVTIAFLLWGFLGNGWAVAWTLFVTIPVYDSIIHCIRSRRFTPFAYPVLITFIYLFIGMQWKIWHPTCVLFITIPIYDAVASSLDKNKESR